MDIRQLECFVAVCKELHFSRAAERLHMSQPSLSRHIKNLEARVGMTLFDRMGRKIALTEAGRILLDHSQRIFHELEQARAAIDDLKGLERGRLTIGALMTCAGYLLPPVLRTFKRMYPNIHLSVLGLRSHEIREKLLENELDLGIVFLPIEDDDLESIPLFTEELALAVPAGHRLARREAVSMRELEDEALLFLPGHYCLRKLIDDYCDRLEMKLTPIMEISPLDALVGMVADGVGATILPAPYIDDVKNVSIVSVRLVDPTPEREIGLAYRKGKFMCTATRVFIEKITAVNGVFPRLDVGKQEAL